MSALCAQKVLRDLRVALFLFFWLIFAKRKSKRGFRHLRMATQGSALRTRKPLKRFDRNFISPPGGIGTVRSRTTAIRNIRGMSDFQLRRKIWPAVWSVNLSTTVSFAPARYPCE